MPRYRQGDRYEFVADSIGNDIGRIVTGTVVAVREVVKADTPGAHDDSADAVVVEWQTPALGTDDNGAPTIVHTPRAWSVGVEEFPEMFKKVKD